MGVYGPVCRLATACQHHRSGLPIQEAALKAAGCEVVRAEKRSGTTTQGRDELRTVRKGDVLMVKPAERRLGELMEVDRKAGKLAKGTRSQPMKAGPGRGKKTKTRPAALQRLGGQASRETQPAAMRSVTQPLPPRTPPLSLTCRGRGEFRARRVPSGPACAGGLLLEEP